jgi:alkanesulfonate monooxygenase SsuD/methylene tetrahydromethanopterin reductase-like flavin-dependent oxidoreductase (luciferase family)
MELSIAIEVQEGVTWEDWTAVAAACEEHGVGSLYSSDHYLSTAGTTERGSLDAWGVICGLAAVTSRLRLGTLVSPTTFRHPSVLAKLAVTADHVSGGRIDLGMGAGWHEREHRAYGFPFADSASRMDVFEEQVAIVAGLLGTAPFSHVGPCYAYAEVDARPKPVRGRIPLIVGGSAGRRSARTAARWADEYNTGAVDAEECRRRRRRLDAACAEAGRDPASLRLSVCTWMLTGRDQVDLDARARAVAGFRGVPDRTPKDLLRGLAADGWLVGTLDAVAEQLRSLAAAGAERVVLALPPHRDLEHVALVGRELAPRAASSANAQG